MADIFDIFKKIEKKAPCGPIEYLAVFLGNPGEKYERTRHNIGMTSEVYIEREEGFRADRLKFKALCADTVFAQKRVLFMRPQTFMNNSGEAVKAAADFYKVQPQNVIVVCDDISLPVGKMRIRTSGSDGGHNGLKSIISHIGKDFPRIKIGVGSKPCAEYDLADWVLGNFSREDEELLKKIMPCVKDALELMLNGKCAQAMNKYN